MATYLKWRLVTRLLVLPRQVVLAAPIGAALDAGASKATVCRSFGIPRSTLNGALARAGWTGGG